MCRPSVGPPAGQLIVPANSNLVPSGLGLRPERMPVFVSFFFLLSSLFLSLAFLENLRFFGVRVYHGMFSWYYLVCMISGKVYHSATARY